MIDPREPADEPLREEDVTAADRLDDRVSESEGLPDYGPPPVNPDADDPRHD